jgi:hypothetical protein
MQDRDSFKEGWTDMASKKEKIEKAGFVDYMFVSVSLFEPYKQPTKQSIHGWRAHSEVWEGLLSRCFTFHQFHILLQHLCLCKFYLFRRN